jgi:membrane-associated phospholipid phosphatase
MIDYRSIKTAFGLNKNKIDRIEAVGDILQAAIIVAALFFIALFPDTTNLTVMNWMYAIIINSVVIAVLKEAIFKLYPEQFGRRPNGGEDSMPSGHTAAAFVGATMFLVAFGWVAAIVPYALAAFTGFSRIAANKHHFRDTVAGAVIGSSIVLLVQNFL